MTSVRTQYTVGFKIVDLIYNQMLTFIYQRILFKKIRYQNRFLAH